MKNKTTAIVLAFFLGGIGIHKFYLNKNTQGVFMLLFCWTLIPAIIAFINFIQLLTMSDAEFQGKYSDQKPENHKEKIEELEKRLRDIESEK